MSRFLLIIPASQKDAANAAAKQHFDALGGELTFTVPLFGSAAQDDSIPSHYWASAEVSTAHVPLLQTMQAGFPGSTLNEYDADAQPAYPHDRLATLNLRTALPRP